ncbi:fumarylacetoacetate hydrolase family protein [Croceicoccus bisphenolivorans]|uniref:fumarylacetoacetate hydrolase family protein n=1 Tax=Croceicoccus bisphenolivorans TaxID=1783232 RepID=UPI00082D0258|nr:fumarylacetoacetate hydrolase family protein [Croceicoccus bisphenolivorans]
MKITGFVKNGRAYVGKVDADGSVRTIADMDSFWAEPQTTAEGDDVVGNVKELELLPATPRTGRVICVGLNYRKHAEETNMPIPTIPMIFGRWAHTLIPDGAASPCIEEKYDWECELGAVVGRRMFRVSEAQAVDGIYGYFAFNDLSARGYQMQTPQWTIGKNSDASGPMSAVVTADEADPIKGLRISTKVNGVVKQDSSTSDMIFNVPQLLSHLSQVMTLEPGDVVVTGTPSGVGFATGEFLKPGDVVEVEIEGIGSVRTPIVDIPAPVF